MKLLRNVLIFSFFLFFFFSFPLRAQVVYDAHTEAELISENTAIRPGEPFWAALRLKTDPHWHTYWQNPGDSGLETRIKWDLPQGFSAGPILWPYPERIDAAGLTAYGYEDETFLLVQIFPPPSIEADRVTIKARADWLACEVPCIPGKGDLSLVLPVSQEEQIPDERRSLFDKARGRLPVQDPVWKITASENADEINIVFFPPDPKNIRHIEFFPIAPDLIEHTAEQSLSSSGQGLGLVLQKNKRTPTKYERLEGVAVVYGNDQKVLQALEVDIPFGTGVPAKAVSEPSGHIAPILFFAFLGGMLLNLMPCVFPVLSIKVLTFVNHAHDKRSLLRSALHYTAGIVVSFFILALALIILREGGEQIGWGFQFQSPYFIVGMAFFLLLLSLNLLGVFEWGVPLLSVSAGKGQKGNEAFFSGVLAVIVATPCTAPFMGTAMSFALTQSKAVNLLVFTFLGLGMAFPFFLFCLWPRLLKFLPKPGAWMENFKKFLAFPLLATVVWLLWVLAGQKGSLSVIFMLAGFVLFALGLWMAAALRTKILQILGVVCMIVGVLWPVGYIRSAAPVDVAQESAEHGIAWRDFDESVLRQVPEDKIVFIDFTARWCLTCQVNERLALDHPDVVAKFKELDIVPVKADWTNHNETISRALAEFGKNSVPFYVILYSVKGQRQEEVLPEILTPTIVLTSIEKVNRIKGGQP